MRTLVVLVLVLVLVAGVAITGSRAQPGVGATSDGFRICRPNGSAILDPARCRSLIKSSVDGLDGDLIGAGAPANDLGIAGSAADPETIIQVAVFVARAAAQAVIGWAVDNLLDYAWDKWGPGGDSSSARVTVEATIFDPSP